jgi:NTP pyrophosphatase (non-canonical NTP hydrolase)
MVNVSINSLSASVYEAAEAKGFWESYWDAPDSLKPQIIAAKLMLCVTELSEACEDLRTGDKEHFKEEIADTIIRIADICGGLGIDIDAEIKKKMEKNQKRERLHGKLF